MFSIVKIGDIRIADNFRNFRSTALNKILPCFFILMLLRFHWMHFYQLLHELNSIESTLFVFPLNLFSPPLLKLFLTTARSCLKLTPNLETNVNEVSFSRTVSISNRWNANLFPAFSFVFRFLTMNELPPMMIRHLFRHRARREGIKIHSNGRNELAFEETGRQRWTLVRKREAEGKGAATRGKEESGKVCARSQMASDRRFVRKWKSHEGGS